MRARTPAAGSAACWGPLWGARAADWATAEEQQAPTYAAAIRRVGIRRGDRVLDVGCGAGVFLRIATDRGARTFGLDASPELLALAHARVPEADLRTGDMQFLPYDDDAFDLVTGFTAFFYAADMVAALREAGRVAKPGAPVVVQVWGRPERCDLEAMNVVARRWLPAPPPGTPSPPALATPGVLERLAVEAGLAPQTAFRVRYAFVYPDADTLGRLLIAPAGIAVLAGRAHEASVREQMVDALSAHRTPDGRYRLCNEFHYLVATAR